MFEIKSRWNDEVIYKSETADNLGDAVLEALSGDRGANLAGANLAGAYLAGANLAGANLAGATGIERERVCSLLMLLDQPGKIRAYKMVNHKNEGHVRGGIKYQLGKEASVDNANTDVNELCGECIHVATLDWCLREWCPSYKILIVEFEAADIACIPTATDGKFRLHRCVVVGEKDVSAIVNPVVDAEEAPAV